MKYQACANLSLSLSLSLSLFLPVALSLSLSISLSFPSLSSSSLISLSLSVAVSFFLSRFKTPNTCDMTHFLGTHSLFGPNQSLRPIEQSLKSDGTSRFPKP